MALLLLAGFALLAALLWPLISRKLRKNEPPGPYCLPIIGYIPALFYSIPGTSWYQIFPKTLEDLGKRYGPIFQVQLGARRVVVLHSAEAMREAYKLETLTGRPIDSPNVDLFREAGEKELLFKDGPAWKLNRRIGMKAIGLFGSSKNSRLEANLHAGLRWFLGQIRENEGLPVNPGQFTIPMTGALISSMCLGTDPNPDDPFFRSVIQAANAILAPSEGLGKLEFFPFLKSFYEQPRQEFISGWGGLMKKVMAQVEHHLKDTDIELVRDMASAVEKAIRETPLAEKERMQTNDSEMRKMLFDLFDVGFFTSSETTKWAMLVLSTFPEIQTKLYDEVHALVPNGQLPTLKDHLDHLHYTRATIYEIQRYCSMFPFGLPHRAMEDTPFMGYIIPRDVMITTNTYAAHHDPANFPDPWSFKPERFLDPTGSLDRSEAEKVLIYGTGRRRCTGEAMVLQTLPTILASIMQNFSVSLAPRTKGAPLKDLRFITVGSILVPGEHKVVFTARKPAAG